MRRRNYILLYLKGKFRFYPTIKKVNIRTTLPLKKNPADLKILENWIIGSKKAWNFS